MVLPPARARPSTTAGSVAVRRVVYAIATFAGTGYAPVAPATVASLAVALLWWWAAPVPLAWQWGLLALSVIVGVPAATALERDLGPDPSQVVIDEVAGMLVTFLGVSTGWQGWLAGFLWFRFTDILKPAPVRHLERLPRGWGIMADDLMAGVYAHVLLMGTLRITGW